MLFKIRCIGFTSWRSKFLGFNRSTLASHICSTDSIPWVHDSREEGPLDYNRGLVRLQVYLKFNTIIHRQQPLFLASLPEQLIKIRSFIAFCVIFSFLLVFLFASTNFWSSSKSISSSLSNPSFLRFIFIFRFLYILFIANPNRRWTATSATNPIILWMIQKNFTG
jgi:hypothetical protein